MDHSRKDVTRCIDLHGWQDEIGVRVENVVDVIEPLDMGEEIVALVANDFAD